MRILIFNTLYYPDRIGGAEISTQILSETLCDLGHDVRVIRLSKNKNKETNIINGVEVIHLPLKNIYWPFDEKSIPRWKHLVWHAIDVFNIFMAQSVKNQIKQFKPDVIHTNNLSGFSVVVWKEAKRNGIRLIHTARDYYLLHPNCTLYKNGKDINPEKITLKIIGYIKRRMSKYVDVFVGISQFIVNYHNTLGLFPKSKSVCIYNPVEKISSKIDDTNFNTIGIGFIGRLEEQKGYEEYLQLCTDMQMKYPKQKFRFVVAGKGEASYTDKIEAKYTKIKLQKLGYVKSSDFFSRVDHVIFPVNWNEPFGRAVVESAISGKCTWVNPKGGIGELCDKLENVRPLEEFDLFKPQINNEKTQIFDRAYIAEQYLKVYSEE